MDGIAFFDVDKTLLDINSAKLWVRREVSTGRLSRFLALKAVGWVLAYELGFARVEKAIEEAVQTLSGQEESDLEQRVAAFYAEEVATRVRPGARDAVARHRAQGDAIALLTSASRYLGQHVKSAVEADHLLCNDFETDDQGRFTGRPVMPLCYGPGKLAYAQKLARELGARLEDCAFYTDSFSDLPVMEKVGHPVAVHPDPRLKRAALRRGWPIELWGFA
ncbi:MAG: HAD family phosphatase [Myxococcota bacterium]